MKEMPLVSVVIPCYNAEKFVEQAVRSIMNQTYTNLEIICINDCSTDSTGEILCKLAKEDSRIVYIDNETNLKLPKTLNKGIELSNGEYIARMDADDISLPERIEKQIDFMLSNEKIDVLGCNLQHIDENNTIQKYRTYMPLRTDEITKKMAWKCVLVHPSILARKDFFVDLNGFNELLSYAEDYELWVRGMIKGKRFANLPEILLHYRSHSQQMSSHYFNLEHSKIIKKFLFDAFKKTNNIYFLFGVFVQTKFMYNMIHLTSGIRMNLRT